MTTSEAPRPNFLDRAKAAKESAQSSVTSLAGEVKGQVAAKASELKDAGLSQVLNTVEDFNACLPVLSEAGYTLSGVDIGIGLPPKVVAEFVVSADVSTEAIEQLLSEHADKKLTVLLLRSLHQAWQLHTRVKIGGLRPHSLSIQMGLIPEVSVKFV